MAPVMQTQIGFPCRKQSVRRKMNFDENDTETSPSKSPRKDESDTLCDNVKSIRLTRSASKPAHTLSDADSKPRRSRRSILKCENNLTPVKKTPSKSAPELEQTSKKTPKKVIIENIENQPVLCNEVPRPTPKKLLTLEVTEAPQSSPRKLLQVVNHEAPRASPRKLHNLEITEAPGASPRKLLQIVNNEALRASPKKLHNLEISEAPRSSPRKLLQAVSNEAPRSSPRKLQLQQPNLSNFTKARQALHTSTPDTICCRDKELAIIGDFLQPHIDERKPGSMYISGRPGTGKTACVTYTLAKRKFSGKFKSIFINCMLLHNPSSIYAQVAEQIDSKWNQNSRDALAYLEDKLTAKGPMIVLVLDEVDQMATKDQSVLYTLFELPALKDSRLILVGLANALDLTDRALIRLQSRSNFKPLLLNFPPYSKQDIATILSQRIGQVSDDVNSVIAPSALQFLGGKISSASGDLRKAIDVCRRAVELAETTAKRQLVLATANDSAAGAAKCVSIPMICKLMSSIDSNRFCADNGQEADETPIQQRLIIVTLLVLVKYGKSKQVTLSKLHQSYGKVCTKYGVTAMDFDEFAHTCSLVETRGIVSLKKKSNARLTPIALRLDEREVEATLKDKTLLSSILTQGAQFV